MYTEYNLVIKMQADSRFHLKIKCIWLGFHHIHPRICLEGRIHFSNIFGRSKNLRNNGVDIALSSADLASKKEMKISMMNCGK